MKFIESLNALCDDLGYGATLADAQAQIQTRLKRWYNEAHVEVLRLPEMADLVNAEISFSSVASQKIYGLPQVFDSVEGMIQQSNGRNITERSRAWLRINDPGLSAEGQPIHYIPMGFQPTMRQPVSTGLWAVSTAAGDTTQNVRIQGVRADGFAIAQVSTTLTGTTRVALGASPITDYVQILTLSLDAVGVGVVSLYDAVTAGNLIAQIPIGQTAVQYVGIRLWPTPSEVLVYVANGTMVMPALVNDNDVPRLPLTYHDMLMTRVRMRDARKKADRDRLKTEGDEWSDWLRKLRIKQGFPPGWKPIACASREGANWSNLGGWYQADGPGAY